MGKVATSAPLGVLQVSDPRYWGEINVSNGSNKCAPLMHPPKGYQWGTGQKRCPARLAR